MSEKILIAYYSWGGNTRKIASLIHEKTEGVIFEIQPISPYTDDYNIIVKQAKKEILDCYRPILETVPDISSYNTVFIGTPNWWSTLAPPVTAFLASVNLSGKIIVPFYSHGGGGAGTIEKDAAKLCPSSIMRNGLSIYGSGGSNIDKEITNWVKYTCLTI